MYLLQGHMQLYYGAPVQQYSSVMVKHDCTEKLPYLAVITTILVLRHWLRCKSLNVMYCTYVLLSIKTYSSWIFSASMIFFCLFIQKNIRAQMIYNICIWGHLFWRIISWSFLSTVNLYVSTFLLQVGNLEFRVGKSICCHDRFFFAFQTEQIFIKYYRILFTLFIFPKLLFWIGIVNFLLFRTLDEIFSISWKVDILIPD